MADFRGPSNQELARHYARVMLCSDEDSERYKVARAALIELRQRSKITQEIGNGD